MTNHGDPEQSGRQLAPPVPPQPHEGQAPPPAPWGPGQQAPGQPYGQPYGQAPAPQYNQQYGQQYGQAPAPLYAPPAPPRKSLNLNIPSAAWIRAAVVVALLLGGSLVASGLIVALGLPQVPDDDVSMGGKWFPLLIQILGMGYGASGHVKVDADVANWVDVSGNLSFFAVPLLVPLIGLLAVRLFGRRIKDGITAPSWAPRLALAVAGGLAFATVVTVVSAIARVKIPLGGSDLASASMSVHTAGFLGYLYQFLIAAAVVYVVFLPRQGAGYWQRTVRDAVVTVAEHLVSLIVVLGITVTIVAVVSDGTPEALFFAPLLIPFMGVAATGLTHLVSIGYAGSASSSDLLEDFLGSGGSQNGSITVFSDEFPAWVWIVAVLIALVWVVVMALRWRVRRGLPGNAGADPFTWVLLPVAYLLAGLALLVTSWIGITMKGGVGGFEELASGTAHMRFHLAWWVFFVMALVGLLVEIASRWVAPGMARTMPRGLFTFLSLGVHKQPTTRYGVPAVAGQPGAELLRPGHERSRRAKRWWLLGLVLALVVALIVAGASVAYSVLAKTTYGPDKQAEKYLDAVVDARAEDALKVYSPDVSKDQRVLLTDEVYSKAKKRPTKYQITDTQIHDDQATVTYSLTIDGKTRDGLLIYLERQGKQAVVFSDWKIVDAPEQSVSIASGPSTMKVNGVEVDFKDLQMSELGESSDSDEDYSYDDDDFGDDEDEGQDGYPALPGEYVFTAPDASRYVSYGEDQSVTVAPGEDAETEGFAPRYTQAVIDDATAQVKKKLNSCVGSKAEYPKGCAVSGWVWDEKGDQPFKMKSRTWYEDPELEIVDSQTEEQVENASDLKGGFEISVRAEVDVKYKYKYDKKDDDWSDRSDSYALSDSEDSWDYRMTLPVKVEEDKVSVDLSGFEKKKDNNSGW